MNILSPKLKSLDYPLVRFRDPSFRRFDTVPACDRRTEGRTDGLTDGKLDLSCSLCIASYADAL